MIKPKSVANMSLHTSYRGWAKTRQLFLAVSGPKFTKFGGMSGSPCRLMIEEFLSD